MGVGGGGWGLLLSRHNSSGESKAAVTVREREGGGGGGEEGVQSRDVSSYWRGRSALMYGLDYWLEARGDGLDKSALAYTRLLTLGVCSCRVGSANGRRLVGGVFFN